MRPQGLQFRLRPMCVPPLIKLRQNPFNLLLEKFEVGRQLMRRSQDKHPREVHASTLPTQPTFVNLFVYSSTNVAISTHFGLTVSHLRNSVFIRWNKQKKSAGKKSAFLSRLQFSAWGPPSQTALSRKMLESMQATSRKYSGGTDI